MVCYTEPVVVNHGVFYWASGWKLWCAMLNQWLLIMDCYAVPQVVNYGVLYWASGCESWCVMQSKWLWIMVCFTAPVVVNHGVLCWVSGCGCELCCAMLVNHEELYWASGCESWFAMLCQWLWVMLSYAVPGMWIMVCNAEPVVVNHGVLCWTEQLWIILCYTEPIVLELWCAMPSHWL
jgi:hypothetical protein